MNHLDGHSSWLTISLVLLWELCGQHIQQSLRKLIKNLNIFFGVYMICCFITCIVSFQKSFQLLSVLMNPRSTCSFHDNSNIRSLYKTRQWYLHMCDIPIIPGTQRSSYCSTTFRIHIGCISIILSFKSHIHSAFRFLHNSNNSIVDGNMPNAIAQTEPLLRMYVCVCPSNYIDDINNHSDMTW